MNYSAKFALMPTLSFFKTFK